MDRDVVTRNLRAMLVQLDALHDRVEAQRSAIRHTLEVVEYGFDDILAEAKDLYSVPPHPETQAGHIRHGIHGILLRERPLHRKEILGRLEKQGYEVGGKKPIDLLSAHLSNDDKFKSAGSGEWTLATEPLDGAEQTRLSPIHTLQGETKRAS